MCTWTQIFQSKRTSPGLFSLGLVHAVNQIADQLKLMKKFTISYSNHGSNLLSWRYKQFAKLEFDKGM
jgi:hypothetical protein